MSIKLKKVNDKLYLTPDQKHAVIYISELEQWMLFRPDALDSDPYTLHDNFDQAEEALRSAAA